MTTAFVLAGGASLGAIEVGMIEALYEREIVPDMLLGTSVGGVNAAFLASRPPTLDTVREMRETWLRIRSREIFPFSPWTLLGALAGRRNHLVSPRSLERVLQRFITIERLEDARIPVGVVVCDLLTGDERLLESGPALPAVMATSAIPSVFPIVHIDGRPYIDGGVANNTPISYAVDRGADEIYVLPTGVSFPLEQPPRTPLAIGVHAVNLMLHARLAREIEELRDQVEMKVLPPPWPHPVLPHSFRQTAMLIERARDEARRFLEGGGQEGRKTDASLERLTP
jgi:NTE family protein